MSVDLKVTVTLSDDEVEKLIAEDLRDLYHSIKGLESFFSKDWKKDLAAVKRVHNHYVLKEDRIK